MRFHYRAATLNGVLLSKQFPSLICFPFFVGDHPTLHLRVHLHTFFLIFAISSKPISAFGQKIGEVDHGLKPAVHSNL